MAIQSKFIAEQLNLPFLIPPPKENEGGVSNSCYLFISSCSQHSACQEMKLSEATKNVAIIENFCCIPLFDIIQLVAVRDY